MMNISDANEVVPGIWLGNRRAALNNKWLVENNISVVFNVTKDLPFSPTIKKQYRVPIDDNLEPEEIRNMTLWSHEILYNIMKEQNAGNNILIHCAAGMQRSAAVIAMYMIAKKGMSWNEAVHYIQTIRPIAFRPGINFKESIVEFNKSYYEEILPRITRLEL